MKLYSKVILTALVAASSITTYAGDYCFSPGRNCNVASSGGGNGSCCDNTGYLFGYGGFSFGTDFVGQTLNRASLQQFLGQPVPTSETMTLDSGFIIGGGAGVRSCFLGGSRFEIEGLYTENSVESVVSNLGTPNVDGEFSTSALMMNFLKEVPLGCATGYIGGGVGIAVTELDLTFAGDFVSDQDFALAHQFIVGADMPISDCFSLFLQYKLFNRGDVDLNCPSGTRGINKATNFESSYQSSLVLGARFFY